MMEKMMVKKMYRVFDELHSDLDLAKGVLKGWEHKEKITEVYAVAQESVIDNLIVPELTGVYLFSSLTEAEEEANAWNEF